MTILNRLSLIAVASACLMISAAERKANADPCGMVPPIYTGPGAPIARIGDQNTFVFFKDGVETFIIHPGFKGKTEEFGMLIPFPAVPELRKVSDKIFPHVRAAIDPPEIVVYAYNRRLQRLRGFAAKGQKSGQAPLQMAQQNKESVRVVKEEAVGMYEVAVLEAGSSKALKKWMDDHGYKYPDGMDKPPVTTTSKSAGASSPSKPKSGRRRASIPNRDATDATEIPPARRRDLRRSRPGDGFSIQDGRNSLFRCDSQHLTTAICTTLCTCSS